MPRGNNMLRVSVILFLALLATRRCHGEGASAQQQQQQQQRQQGPDAAGFGPSLDAARRNAPLIFNAVHDAMRQFGSSLHHNGMSFFPATIPAGTLLYHGSGTPRMPSALEWLAFEVEHAENFAHGWVRNLQAPATPSNPVRDASFVSPGVGQDLADSQEQHPLRSPHYSSPALVDDGEQGSGPSFRASFWARLLLNDDDNNDDGGGGGDQTLASAAFLSAAPPLILEPGYLHVYQATRPLRVLYLDGMAAAKTSYGTTDAEDLVLTGNRTRRPREDYRRAEDLCAWARAHALDGVIRMEPGFELIYCDFGDGGLRQASALRRARAAVTRPWAAFKVFTWLRAAAQRYRGIGAGRVRLDYSAMVSAFFYPLDLAGGRADDYDDDDDDYYYYPRLTRASDADLAHVRAHVERAARRSRAEGVGGEGAIDWQGVTDLVVTRFADNLQHMAAADSVATLKPLIKHLLETYSMLPETDDERPGDGGIVDPPAVLERCAMHYLEELVPRTPEDELIYAGVEGTTRLVCRTLLQANELVAGEYPHSEPDEDGAVREVAALVQELMHTLHWAEWKECGSCKSDETCIVAMWPFGSHEDHHNPGCRNQSMVLTRDSYWGEDMRWY